MLNSGWNRYRWNINYQSTLSHKCHNTNHVDVYCNRFEILDNFKVWYFNISSTFVTHIVSHNVRDISRWIPLISFYEKSRILRTLGGSWKSISRRKYKFESEVELSTHLSWIFRKKNQMLGEYFVALLGDFLRLYLKWKFLYYLLIIEIDSKNAGYKFP